MDRIVPESFPWEHTDEGPEYAYDLAMMYSSQALTALSDSVSHLKTSLLGNSITLPIAKGKLVLGTWQGIYLAEFRHSGSGWGGGGGRKVVATVLWVRIVIVGTS